MIEIKVPHIEGIDNQSKLLALFKKEGDLVFQGDIVAELENNNFVFDVKSNFTGVIERILKNSGDSVITDDTIFIISTDYDPKKYENLKTNLLKKQKDKEVEFVEFNDFLKNSTKPKQEEISPPQSQNTDTQNNFLEKNHSFEENENLNINTSFTTKQPLSNSAFNEDSTDSTTNQLNEIPPASTVDNLISRINAKKSENLQKDLDNSIESIQKLTDTIHTQLHINQNQADEKQKILKNLIKKASNQIVDKEKESVLLNLTDKIKISWIINSIKSNFSNVPNIAQENIKGVYPILLKAVDYAIEQTNIFNKNVINVLIENYKINISTSVTNLGSKKYNDILEDLSKIKNHTEQNALLVIFNETSTLATPNRENCILFNKIFIDNGEDYIYCSLHCNSSLTAIFFKNVVEFLQNPMYLISNVMV